MSNKRLSGIAPQLARALAKVGKDQGADLRQWYVSFVPVPASRWLAVEVWHDGPWAPVDLEWRPPVEAGG